MEATSAVPQDNIHIGFGDRASHWPETHQEQLAGWPVSPRDLPVSASSCVNCNPMPPSLALKKENFNVLLLLLLLLFVCVFTHIFRSP